MGGIHVARPDRRNISQLGIREGKKRVALYDIITRVRFQKENGTSRLIPFEDFPGSACEFPGDYAIDNTKQPGASGVRIGDVFIMQTK